MADKHSEIDDDNPWKLALESSGAGMWDWHLVTGVHRHSPRWEELIGFEAGELPQHYDTFASRLHPDDVESHRLAAEAYQQRRTPRFSVDIRMRCKDGSWKWISTNGMVVSRDAQGLATRMVGTHTDISGLKHTEAERLQLTQALQEKTSLLQTTLTHISQGVLVFDAQHRVIAFNPRVCELLDLSPDFLSTRPNLVHISQLQQQRGDFGPQNSLASQELRAYLNNQDASQPTMNYLRETPAGRIYEVKSQILPDGGMVRTVADVTEHLHIKAELQENEARWKLALESTGDGLWDLQVQTGQEYLSPSLLRMYGFDPGDLNPTMEDRDHHTHPDDIVSMQRDRQAHLAGLTPTYSNEHRVLCKNGTWKWVLSRGMVISRDADGTPLRMIGTHTDITERKVAEALVWQQAHFDALTGLPNRRMMRERLREELKKCRRGRLQLALLLIDLDHFKEVNDTLGHDRGDTLLTEAARRISSCLREVDTVARMGGDEFTVIISELHDPKDLEAILDKILLTLGSVFQLGLDQVFVSASIGVTVYPNDAVAIEDLMKNADQALYVAKGAGRNRYSFYTPALQEAAQLRAQLSHDLRTALASQQFRVYYQPIVTLATGTVHKAEALVRWLHPTRGMVSPADFIPVAESSGLITALGEWVFQQAADQVHAWRSSLHPQFQISVNKSPVQFENTHTGHAPWIDQLRARGLDGDSIVVEITEGLLLSTSEGVVAQLLRLRDDGIGVSLDDFGTGYSSLSYLQKFDIDYIKIDQSFVRNLQPNSTNLALCQAIVAMAHALGMRVIAEGVETEQQRNLLLTTGCDYAQGYFYSRPVPADVFTALHRTFG